VASVELVAENAIRLTSSATLDDIYRQTDEWRLPVEPLSRLTPIIRFLNEGGYGYGSLTEGSLASKIFRLSWIVDGKSYGYGLDNSTLYNAGYPLQRIVDMGESTLLEMDFGQIVSVTFLAVEPSTLSFRYVGQDIEAISIPAGATNALFVNEKAASLFGLPKAGLLATFEVGGEGEDARDAWGKRFVEDSLPSDLQALRMLTVKSNLKHLADIAGDDSHLLILACLKGFVANIYCTAQVKAKVNEAIGSMKHCYPI